MSTYIYYQQENI